MSEEKKLTRGIAALHIIITVLLAAAVAFVHIVLTNAHILPGDHEHKEDNDHSETEDIPEYFPQTADKRCNLQNLADNNVDGVLSHNEFYMPDGELCTVDIVMMWDKAFKIYVEKGGECRQFPVTISSKFAFKEPFSLKLADYNGDGSPDFCVKTGEQGSDGEMYAMILLDCDARESFRYHNDGGVVSGESFLVCREAEDSIRLDRINRDTYFFLTRKANAFSHYPAVYNNAGERVRSDGFLNHGAIFSSYYENGQIELKAVNTSLERFDHIPSLTLKRLDGKIWRDTGIALDERVFSISSFENQKELFDCPLETGLYRIEICIDGEYTQTEFYVK